MIKKRKILSFVTAVAVTVSAFSSFTLTSSAKTSAYGPLTYEEATETGFTDAGRGASSLVTDFEGNTGKCVLMNNSGSTKGTIKSKFTAVEAPHIGMYFDTFITSSANTWAKHISIGTENLGRVTGNGVDAANAVIAIGNVGTGTIMVNGSVNTGIPSGKWISVAAIADFGTKTVDVTITEFGADTVLYEGTVDFLDSSVTVVSGVTINAYRGVKDPAIYFDNFELCTFEEAVISKTADSVEVAADADAVVATVTNATEVTVTPETEGIVELSYDEATGEVKASHVSTGKVTVTIKATSADGVSISDTVDVLSGGIETASVNVNYVYIDGENTVTVKEGYVIEDVPVDTAYTLADLTYDETVADGSYRYTNPAIDGDGYTVVSGDNTINIVYADRAAAVSKIAVSYTAGDTVVSSGDVAISSGLYEGDSYTYISNNYVKDADGKIYAVGNDYTEDIAATILSNATTPVNSVLKKTVTLALDTTISYEVTESPDAVFYGEWEDVLGTTGGGYSTARYIASGGKMATTTKTVPFYDVTDNGYYQIIFAGGPKSRGTGIYQTEELAAAATAATDGTAILGNTLTGSANNSNDFGFYTVKTVYLNAGDKLTIRGFGTGSSTDNLDYILIRNIVTGSIVGADGISIIGGGQNAEYTFDSGLEGTPVWSVTGVDGVTVDENGVVTVAETAAEGTATLTAALADAGVEGTKELTIAKAQIQSFEFDGVVAFSNGQSTTYSVSEVKDQFGADITAGVTAEYSSSDENVIKINNDGVATAVSVGSADITVVVKAGESSMTETKTVTIKDYFLAGEATGDSTAIDSSELVTSDNITGYLVTTAKDGVVVKQETVTEIPAAVDTTGADSYEVAPVYKYEKVASGTTFADIFADGFYNITFKKDDKQRTDIRVNGYMVANNVDQYGEGRSIAEGAEYTINHAVVEGGSITVSKSDNKGTTTFEWVEVVKAPSNVTRATKVYVLGDSLIADYYGSYTSELGTAQTGVGQQLRNFVTDDAEIVNLANSGQYAAGLLGDAFPGIVAMAQPGDYMVLESGYNDQNYSNRTEMYNSIVSMVEQAEAIGVIPVLVSPNASANPYRADVKYTSTMTQAAEDMNAKYGNVIYVNLAHRSYEHLESTGIARKASDAGVWIEAIKDENGTLVSTNIVTVEAGQNLAKKANAEYYLWSSFETMKPVAVTQYNDDLIATYTVSDKLHSSYAGAMKWASIVAQGMYDAGVDFINKDFSYSFTDTIGNVIECQVK